MTDEDISKHLNDLKNRLFTKNASGKLVLRPIDEKPRRQDAEAQHNKAAPSSPPKRQKIEIDYVPLIRGRYDLTDDFIRQNSEQIVAWETRARACERCNGHLQKLGQRYLQCKTQNTLDAHAASRTPCLLLLDATADKLPEQETIMGILDARYKAHTPTLIISVRPPVDFTDFGFSDGSKGVKVAEYIADAYDIVDISKGGN